MLARFLFLAALRMTTLVVVFTGRCSYQVASRAVRMRITSRMGQRPVVHPEDLPTTAMAYCSKCGIYTIPAANPCRAAKCPI